MAAFEVTTEGRITSSTSLLAYKYQDADKSYGATRDFSHAEIHKSIESKFKVKTYFVPQHRFEEVSNYVKQRIDRTILGKNNAKKGILNYESFDNFIAQQ